MTKRSLYKNSNSLSHLFLSIFITISIFSLVIFKQKSLFSFAQIPSSFTFTAAGDYGANGNASAVLSAINPVNSGASFNLALGDLSYLELTPETAWCDLVKNNVGQDFPFELVSGNHEDDAPAPNSINNFALCLPERIGNITGSYAKEYYFDYPQTSPLARIIMIAADLTIDGSLYSYTIGSSRYNWLSQAIDNARSSGIRWVVVGMHKNCITIGTKNCAISTDLLNLLVDKKVDLILQAHDHNYQRSKQLSLSPACTGILANSYNSNCVVDDGSDNSYIKDAGPVIVIVGTGGKGLYDINPADPEAGYFANWSGNNSQPSWGFLKFTTTDSQMTAQFIPVSGTFTETFTIVDSGLPSPTPPPPTPTNTPTATPPPGITTVSSQINSSADDAEQNISTGGVNITSTDLELGADGTAAQIVGMRFQNVQVPNNANIINAYAEFEVDEVSTGTTSVTFWGETTDNPSAFSTSSQNISLRPKTISSVAWNLIPPWNTLDDKWQSPDLSPIIQEIVNRSLWNPGNAIVLTTQGSGRRTAEAYDGEIPAAAKLVVVYSTEPTPTQTPSPSLTPSPTIDPFAPTPTETPTPTYTPTPTVTPKPTLTPIPTDTPSPTPTPNTFNLNPLTDAFVKSSSSNSNYGSRINLNVDGSPIAVTYMKFDLTQFAGMNIQSAKLRIRTETDISNAPQTVKSVNDITWTETGITYNNKPALGAGITAFTAPVANTWFDIDITPEVVSRLGQIMSVGIDQTSSNGMYFSSKESAYKPVLIVSYN